MGIQHIRFGGHIESSYSAKRIWSPADPNYRHEGELLEHTQFHKPQMLHVSCIVDPHFTGMDQDFKPRGYKSLSCFSRK